MPQNDRHRTRIVPIEFAANELLNCLPYQERVTLVLVSNGNASVTINNRTWSVNAPCVFCLSHNDQITLLHAHNICAQSFSFHPTFLNYSLSFEALAENAFTNIEDQHDRNMLMMFLRHSNQYVGLIAIPPKIYLCLSEWLNIIGAETFNQSDGYWTCRIRRYLLQILYLVDDVYMDMVKNGFTQNLHKEKEYVELAIEYIHTNYQSDITLDDLCKFVNMNRTSLNRKFKEQTGYTSMNYLIHHRIRLACEALFHTNLKIGEIAEACGFKYDNYFIKQFTKKMRVTPSEYRQREWDRKDRSR